MAGQAPSSGGSKLSAMDPVWANTWRRFIGLRTQPLPSRRRPERYFIDHPAARAASAPPDVDEHTARRMLAEINSREGRFIDYD